MKKKIMFFACLLFMSLCLLPNGTGAYGNPIVEVVGTIEGEVGETSLDEDAITVTLGNEREFTGIETGDDVTEWFNLPEELYATVVSASQTSFSVLVDLDSSNYDYLETEGKQNIVVEIPDGYIVGYTGSVTSENNDESYWQIIDTTSVAYYSVDAEVRGTVSEPLISNTIYVKLENDRLLLTGLDSLDIDPGINNGLTARISNVDEDNIITITYTGIPNREDYSDIDITIPSSVLEYSTEDLVVQVNGKKVKFNIGPYIPPYIPGSDYQYEK